MSNAAAAGYAIMAAKRLGLSKQEIRKLEAVMYALMDRFTEEEAEEVYRNN